MPRVFALLVFVALGTLFGCAPHVLTPDLALAPPDAAVTPSAVPRDAGVSAFAVDDAGEPSADAASVIPLVDAGEPPPDAGLDLDAARCATEWQCPPYGECTATACDAPAVLPNCSVAFQCPPLGECWAIACP